MDYQINIPEDTKIKDLKFLRGAITNTFSLRYPDFSIKDLMAIPEIEVRDRLRSFKEVGTNQSKELTELYKLLKNIK